MAKGDDWSPQEIQATVMDYMAMLQFELTGQTYNKSAHRRALRERLEGRSDASVEKKHQNISAALRDMGHFWIPGYKPLSNYQRALGESVEAWIDSHPLLDRQALAAAEAPVSTPEHIEFEKFLIDVPSAKARHPYAVREEQKNQGAYRLAQRHDYAAREARNRMLGAAGEELVVKYEQFRLSQIGQDRLAAKIEHVAKTQGDGLGFDVLSYEADGRERFIEVKTTAFAKETSFYASSSEVSFANKHRAQYALYRLFEFKKSPRCFVLSGAIGDHCALDPVSYRCSLM